MRVSTILILLVIIGGLAYVGHTKGWFKKGEGAVENSFSAHYQKGQGLYSQEEYEGGIEELKKALELDPKHDDAPECMARIGDCYKELGLAKKDPEMTKKAIEYYDKTIKTYPESDIKGRVEQSKIKTQELGHW